MKNWIKTPNGAKDIPVGDWCVVMEDGELGYCKARQGGNCTHHVVNGYFHYDHEKVIAYTSFPSPSEEEHDG